MPSQRETAALFFSRRGAESLLGNTAEQIDTVQLTDTAGVADGQPQFYFDGSDLLHRVLYNGTWYVVTLPEEV